LIAEHDEAFLKTAAAYFHGLIAWYAEERGRAMPDAAPLEDEDEGEHEEL
jgi:hypothetical protein